MRVSLGCYIDLVRGELVVNCYVSDDEGNSDDDSARIPLADLKAVLEALPPRSSLKGEAKDG